MTYLSLIFLSLTFLVISSNAFLAAPQPDPRSPQYRAIIVAVPTMFETIAALSTIAFIVVFVVLFRMDRISRSEEQPDR
jgi:hypothetical protein